MGPIVCSVDDSDAAPDVVHVARELAVALGARLVLVTVAPPTEAPGVSAAAAGQERLREQELADARRLLEGLASRGDVPAAEIRAETGPVADRVLALCRAEEASLLVVGSRGRGDLASAVLGSVSHRVASSAPCPVVIVPPGASGKRLT